MSATFCLESGDIANECQEYISSFVRKNRAFLSPTSVRGAITDRSVVAGHAGLALLYAHLDSAQLIERDPDAPFAWVTLLAEGLALDHTPVSLFGGAAGVGFVIAHLLRMYPDLEVEDQYFEQLTTFIRSVVSISPWGGHFDLIRGLTGYGVFFLELLPDEVAAEGLAHVVARLTESAVEDDEGTRWFTAPELLTPVQKGMHPGGWFDLGLAHGLPGVMVILAAASAYGIERPRAESLLERSLGWLRTQRTSTKFGWTYPAKVVPGTTATPTRAGWCYGDVGIAAALAAISDYVRDSSLALEAHDIIESVLTRPAQATSVTDPHFCHGAIGIAHILARFYERTGDSELRYAAMEYFSMAYRLNSEEERNGAEPSARKQVDLLAGEASLILPTISALIGVTPHWDRLFLLSSRLP